MTFPEQDFLLRRNLASVKKNIPNFPKLLLTKLVDNVGLSRAAEAAILKPERGLP
jgi:hypothetical protein